MQIDDVAAEQAPQVAIALSTSAHQAHTEAQFRTRAAILHSAARAADLAIVPRDEYSVARGRLDSVYNRFVLEYKRPGTIQPTNEGRTNQDIIDQVKGYLIDLGVKERRDVHRLAAVATDGFYYIFIRRVGIGWVVDDPLPVDTPSTERFLRLLFSLSSGAALIPENLIEDFGPRTLRAQRAVRALYSTLHSNRHPLVANLFDQWATFYSQALSPAGSDRRWHGRNTDAGVDWDE